MSEEHPKTEEGGKDLQRPLLFVGSEEPVLDNAGVSTSTSATECG